MPKATRLVAPRHTPLEATYGGTSTAVRRLCDFRSYLRGHQQSTRNPRVGGIPPPIIRETMRSQTRQTIAIPCGVRAYISGPYLPPGKNNAPLCIRTPRVFWGGFLDWTYFCADPGSHSWAPSSLGPLRFLRSFRPRGGPQFAPFGPSKSFTFTIALGTLSKGLQTLKELRHAQSCSSLALASSKTSTDAPFFDNTYGWQNCHVRLGG